jgi:hypothetical protein
MKKLMLAVALMVIAVSAKAQYSAGDITVQPKVGLNFATMSSGYLDYKTGFVCGVEGEYHASSLIGISAGFLYSDQGAKGDDYVNYGTWNVQYINVPILANFYLFKGFAVKAGIQPGFKTGSNHKFEGEKIDYSSYTKSFDFSIPVGVSYEFKNICLDVRGVLGCTDVYKTDDVNNTLVQVTLGYKFKL